MKELSIYVHIPFCTSKCLYCDFTSQAIGHDPSLVQNYIDSVIREIDLYKEVLKTHVIKSLFIGGGTPSSIDGHYVASIINQIKGHTIFDDHIEMTIECNPETINADKLKVYKDVGINRLSIGLQSTHNNLLIQIGRQHDYETFEKSYELARNMGFENINVDLMFGLPGQGLEAFKDSIFQVMRLKPQHIASYGLKIEEGTPFYELEKKGLLELVDESEERDMYHLLVEELEKKGYFQYELSNFALENAASKHNLVYWENKPYLGLGVSAHSKIDSCRFNNTPDLKAYVKRLEDGQKPIEAIVAIDEAEDLFETIMLGLRLNKGISMEAIESKYAIDFKSKYKKELDDLLAKELILIEGNRIKLTPLGRDLSNQVFVSFL